MAASRKGGGRRKPALPRGPRKKLTTAAAQKRFCAMLARTGNVSASARHAGIATSTLYAMKARSLKFKAEWQAALDEALDALEESLLDRAINGVRKPIVYGGKVVEWVTQFSDAAAIFMLRSRRRDVYGPEPMTAAPVGDDKYDEETIADEFARRLILIQARNGASETPLLEGPDQKGQED